MAQNDQLAQLEAEKHPVRRETDFMGKEHFRTFGRLAWNAAVTPRTAGMVFHGLVNPRRSWYSRLDFTEARQMYEDHGIRVLPRAEAGLEPLPKQLCQVYSIHIDNLAITAGSVLYLADHSELLDDFRFFRSAFNEELEPLKALRTIAEVVREEIAKAAA